MRIFKSRTLSATVCKQGHVRLDGKALKPSATVRVGDELEVRRNGYQMRYRVDALVEKRVGAPVAVTCYTDLTPEEELRKYDHLRQAERGAEFRDRGTGRPTKRERRDIDAFKDHDAPPGWEWTENDPG